MSSKRHSNKRKRVDDDSDTQSQQSPADDIVDDETWTEGDMTIISADNVRLRIPSCYVLAASPVFQDAATIAGEGRREITFTDHDIETAAIVRFALELAKYGYLKALGPVTDTANAKTRKSLSFEVGGLYKFLRKWECQALLHTLQLNLLRAIEHGQVSSKAAFLVAAIGDDDIVASHVLKTKPEIVWGSAKSTRQSAHYGIDGASCWNPTQASLHFTLTCPPTYLWALGRAFQAVGATKDLHSKFSRYIATARKTKWPANVVY